MSELNRRNFLAGATAATVALASRPKARAAAASDKVVLAIMGVNNRGSQLATSLANVAGAEIAYVCDCDEQAIPKGIAAASSHGRTTPQGIKDFRQALDDPAVDALICAAPNHWHAPATILACAAGKHVYCEKPASHTPEEGERMIAAARDAKRVVQVGLQRRSNPNYVKALGRVQEGAIGRLLYAKSTYFSFRDSIGRGKETSPSSSLDYDLWQGAALEQPYRSNLIPYNWHFFWHWGNGEVGNNGVHTIDVCRWALGVDYPTKTTTSGAKLRFDDDQETPDTYNVTWDFDGRQMVWEGISWSKPFHNNSGIGIELRGEDGVLYIDDSGYRIIDMNKKVVEKGDGKRDEVQHLTNFLNAVRNGSALNCDIEDGHKSTLLCHLANIACRTGQTVETDATNGHIKDNPAAEALWMSEYRKGWLPSA